MECRICKTDGEQYENAMEGNWNYGVCKVCCGKEVRRRSAEAKEKRANGLEDPDAKMTCWKCQAAKHISAFPPYHVAGGSIGFAPKCITCDLEYRKSLQEKRTEQLQGVKPNDPAPMACGRCKASLPLKAFSAGVIRSWAKGSSCYCRKCKKEYNAELYQRRKAKKAAAQDDYSDLV